MIRSTLANSGFTVNRLWFARLLGRHPLVGRLLRLRLTPEILPRLNELPTDPESGSLYAAAVTWMRVGRAMKTVGVRRNSLADEVLLRLVRTESLTRICDIGVSDGSASIGILEALPGAKIRLFDKFNYFLRRARPLGADIYNAAEERVYRRIGPLLLYVYDWPRASSPAGAATRLPVRNPLLRTFGVEIEELDLFAQDLDERFEFIKCCNCLNLEFYPPEKLAGGMERLLSRLTESGYLLVGQNHPRYEGGEAYFVLRRRGSGSILVEERSEHDLLRWLRRHRPAMVGEAGIPPPPG